MKITDKQRIDFVQRHGVMTHYCKHEKRIGKQWSCLVMSTMIVITEGRTWRQAVDKAIKAYMEGRSEH